MVFLKYYLEKSYSAASTKFFMVEHELFFMEKTDSINAEYGYIITLQIVLNIKRKSAFYLFYPNDSHLI